MGGGAAIGFAVIAWLLWLMMLAIPGLVDDHGRFLGMRHRHGRNTREGIPR